jgi:hypothetical protein
MKPASFSFGSFSWFCSRAALHICNLLDEKDPICYARNISIGKVLIFQPAVILVNVAACLLTFVMVSNIKSKYTAVGMSRL